MTIKEYMKKQKELDDIIINEKQVEMGKKEWMNALFCALFSEIYETKEAVRIVNNKADYPMTRKTENDIIEEYIDCFFFLLSIGYRLGINLVFEMKDVLIKDNPSLFDRVVDLMDGIKAYKFWSNKEPNTHAEISARYLFVLSDLKGEIIKNTTVERKDLDEVMEKAYKAKYQENIDRQKRGY